MRRRYVIVAILCLSASDARMAFADETFAALKAEYDTAVKAWGAENSAAVQAAQKKGDDATDAGNAFRLKKPRPDAAYSPRFLAIAEANPTGPDALEALCMTLTTSAGSNGVPLNTRARAIILLRHDYVTSPDVGQAAKIVARYDQDDAKAFVAEVIARNPDRAIQAAVYQAIANACGQRAALGIGMKTSEKLREVVEKRGGKEKVARLIADAEKLKQEAERIKTLLLEKYADVLQDLSIGAKMAALVSEDLNGKTVTLDEFKGKVVVLDFWATKCVPCRQMIPHQREMVQRLKGKPFALVSIGMDAEKKTYTDFLAKEPMPWNHWWIGAGSKLADTLNIRFWPTIFVLDPHGVIRYKNIHGEELERAVNTLLPETQKAEG